MLMRNKHNLKHYREGKIQHRRGYYKEGKVKGDNDEKNSEERKREWGNMMIGRKYNKNIMDTWQDFGRKMEEDS